ncbi:MAG: response regulator transcription factor [Propionibacteriaceae bacterium]|nr:response regulator transcription factor [Propionibacteriaceae bacterium]
MSTRPTCRYNRTSCGGATGRGGAGADDAGRRRLGVRRDAGRGPRLPAQERRSGGDQAGTRHGLQGRHRVQLGHRQPGARLLRRGGASTAAVPFPELTEREREILDLVARGLTNTEIASRRVLSPKTVRNHVNNVFTKLQVATRAEAVAHARDAGLGGRRS